jgi:hypothetical protein
MILSEKGSHMTRKLLLVFSILLVCAFTALAADFSGKWTAQVPGRNNETRETTFTFKVDGDKVTGTMSGGQGGDVAIADGKVSGDTITFSITRERGGQTMKNTYTGTMSGAEIKFKREGGQRGPQEFTAKKAVS